MVRFVTSFDSVVLAAVVRDLHALVGGVLSRVMQPGPDELALELHGRQPAAVVCSIHERWGRIHCSQGRAATGPLSPFAQMLRGRLDHARLTGVHHPPFERVVTLQWDAARGPLDLIAEIMGRHSNLMLVEDGVITGSLRSVSRSMSSVREVLPGRPYLAPPRDRRAPDELTIDDLRLLLSGDAPLAKRLVATVLGIGPATATDLVVRAGLDPAAPSPPDAAPQLWPVLQELAGRVQSGAFDPVAYYDGDEPVGFAAFPLVHLAGLRPVRVPSMSAAVEAVMARVGAAATIEEQRAVLRRAVDAALARVRRAQERLAESVNEANQIDTLRQQGELLLAYASQVPAGSSQVILTGFDGTPVTIALDPALSAVDNAQRIFRRYTKARGARPAVTARLRDLAAQRVYLESTLAMIDQAATPDDLFDLRRELIDENIMRSRKHPARPSAAAGPRRFVLPSGDIVLVGRTNQENDRLTFKLAAPNDLWLHARGAPGAHVVVRSTLGTPGEAVIRRAAAIAAYFSRGRDAAAVAVDYTLRKHVRKPKGSPSGLVTYDHERTVHVKPELPEPRS